MPPRLLRNSFSFLTIPNLHSGVSSPPCLSYWSNNTPSGLYSFPVKILPVRFRPSNPFCHIICPTSLLLLSHIYSAAVFIPVVPHHRHHDLPPPSSPLIWSAIPIILHLHCASVVILPRLCCGPHQIIFHCPVYFYAVVYLPSWIGYSPRSDSLCTTLIAPLCSTLIYSLSSLIFSLRFYLLFWHGYSLCV